MNKNGKGINQHCARVALKRFSTDSFSDNDVDETLNVGQFVTVEVHQEHGSTSPAGTELDAGLGLLSGAHIADPARDAHGARTHRHQRSTEQEPKLITQRTCVSAVCRP